MADLIPRSLSLRALIPPPAFDWNPLHWLGSAASKAASDAWTSAMVSCWSGVMWLLRVSFQFVDTLTTPDLTAGGPLHDVYGYTFGIAAAVVLILAMVQIGAAAFRRDGPSLGRVLVGVFQFGAVWLGYVGVAAALVFATSGLTHGMLEGLLGIHGFHDYAAAQNWPRHVTDPVVATVLGLTALFLVWPAAIAYILIMLVREAALMVLAATAPISAAGLLSESTRAWFWKSLRWFIAALLIAPLAALILGIGTKISQGIVEGRGQSTEEAVGMAVIGSILILVGALCPLILFRLLAFVDPGTSSGAAFRSTLAANGGLGGLLGGGADEGGGAASWTDGEGRSQGEASADQATQSRFASGAGVLGAFSGSSSPGLSSGLGRLGSGLARAGQQAVSVGSDVLGASGVGHQQPYYPQYETDQRGQNRGVEGHSSSRPIEDPMPTGGDEMPPDGGDSPPAGPPSGSDGPAAGPPPSSGTAAGGGAAGGGAEAAAVAAL